MVCNSQSRLNRLAFKTIHLKHFEAQGVAELVELVVLKQKYSSGPYKTESLKHRELYFIAL